MGAGDLSVVVGDGVGVVFLEGLGEFGWECDWFGWVAGGE